MVVIETAADLRALQRKTSYRDTADDIQLDVSHLDPDESERWERALNRYAFSCGCELGSAFLVAAIIAYLGVRALQPLGLGAIGWQQVGIALAIGVVAALVGKLVGLLYARIRLQLTVEGLHRRLTSRDILEPAKRGSRDAELTNG